MANGIVIRVRGLDQIRKKFKSIPDDLAIEADATMAAVGSEFVDGAVSAAPTDQGLLRNLITLERKGLMNYSVTSAADYSPFVEFGTRGRTRVPSGLQAYATQFKNAKSTGAAKKMIYDWCKRKGIDKKLWFVIYRSIMTKGIHPHPFFFPQLPIAQQKLINNLKEAIAKVLK